MFVFNFVFSSVYLDKYESLRLAVKLSIDECVFGEAETVEKFIENLTELLSNWYIGLETDAEWARSIEQSKKYVFSLGFNKDGIYSSRTLTLAKVPVFTGELNSESVRAIWSALSFELLYLTNDDEERYSIQAHPTALRNIVTQTAALPLGYPVFSSGACRLLTF